MAKLECSQDAFSFYLTLRRPRGYEAVAQHFGVPTEAVDALAEKEEWLWRAIEAEGVSVSPPTREELRAERLAALRLIMEKALDYFRRFSFEEALQMARDLDARKSRRSRRSRKRR